VDVVVDPYFKLATAEEEKVIDLSLPKPAGGISAADT
jgi:hypothetical protein